MGIARCCVVAFEHTGGHTCQVADSLCNRAFEGINTRNTICRTKRACACRTPGRHILLQSVKLPTNQAADPHGSLQQNLPMTSSGSNCVYCPQREKHCFCQYTGFHDVRVHSTVNSHPLDTDKTVMHSKLLLTTPCIPTPARGIGYLVSVQLAIRRALFSTDCNTIENVRS